MRFFYVLFHQLKARFHRYRESASRYFQSKRQRYDICRMEEEYAFLPAHLEVTERPPAPWARCAAWLMLGFLLLVLLWTLTGQLDIHASAPGRVIVAGHSKIIQPLEQSEIVAIDVQNGQHVKIGQVLIRFNPVETQTRDRNLHQQIATRRSELARFTALLSEAPLRYFVPPADSDDAKKQLTRQLLQQDVAERQAWLSHHAAEMGVNRAQYEAGQQHITAQYRLLANVKRRLGALRQLLKKQAIAKVQVLEQEREELNTEAELSRLNSQQTVLQAQYQAMSARQQHYLSEKKREDSERLNQAADSLMQLTQEDINVHDKQRTQTLRAPVDGRVQQLALHTLGGVVTPAQPLMVIVPDKTTLEVDAVVLNKDAGFIFPGQQVAVKIDSFPYTRYGTVSGEVSHISGDALEDDKLGAVFPVHITLKTDRIKVDGQSRRLSAGMSVVAEIRTGKRRIIDYLLSPIREYQAEAWRER